jgi:hypothetical protein
MPASRAGLSESLRRLLNTALELAQVRLELLRRERLIQRRDPLRAAWSQQVQVLRTPLGVADQARSATRWLMPHPEWPLGGIRRMPRSVG